MHECLLNPYLVILSVRGSYSSIQDRVLINLGTEKREIGNEEMKK